MAAARHRQQQQHALPQQHRLQHEHMDRAAISSHEKYASSPIASTSATCSQCHLIQAVFYCTTCLSERIILQHADRRRLGEARQRARDRVDILLGVVEAPSKSISTVETQLPNPFIESHKKGGQRRGTRVSAPITGPHHGASIPDRIARARISKLQTEIEETIKSTTALRERLIVSRRKAAERRHQLDRRKRLLATVQSSEDQGALSQLYVEGIRSKVEELQVECKEVAEVVTQTRARLIRTAYEIFNVQTPDTVSRITNKVKDARLQTSINSRSQRSRERYSGSAFAIDFTNAFDLGKTFRESKSKDDSSKNNDWTILGLALPTPTDISKIDRAEINGAIHHTVQLLQLVTAYLDITLPFVFSMQGNSPQIRANPLWGAGLKETLHLSEATYNSICQTSGSGIPSTVGSMGASMMSTLGASTLSTLESFVQLPSAKNLPWSKGETTQPQGNEKGSLRESQDNPQSNDDPSTINARRFCTALTMLSFDVAYLVHLQGIKIDLIMAAGNTLRLISRAIQSPDLGKVSHITFIRASNLSNLQIPTVDFAQLSQVHDPCSSKNKNKVEVASMDKKLLSGTTIMEESYVDAKKAAESILNLDQRKQSGVNTVQQAIPSSHTAAPLPSIRTQQDKMSSLAAKRVQVSVPPASVQRAAEKDVGIPANKDRQLGKGSLPPTGNTLDFLRARGQRDIKTPSMPSPKALGKKEKVKPSGVSPDLVVPTTSIPRGTVTFNGKEVRGKAKASPKNASHRAEEDGWHVL